MLNYFIIVDEDSVLDSKADPSKEPKDQVQKASHHKKRGT